MHQYGSLLAFGSGEKTMDAFISNFLITAALLFFGVIMEIWSRNALLGLIVFFFVIDLGTFFFYRMRAKTKIFVCEHGIMGRAIAGVFSATDFSLPYVQIARVDAKQKHITVYTHSGKLTIAVANGLELQHYILGRLQAMQGELNYPVQHQ